MPALSAISTLDSEFLALACRGHTDGRHVRWLFDVVCKVADVERK